jgi:uncharacterized protein (TIGR03000 family)
MMLRQCLWAVLAFAVSLLAVSDSSAWGRRGPAVIESPDYFYPPFAGNAYPMTYGFPYNTPYGFPYTIPYVAPYPYYGILPPPFATMQRYYDNDPRRTAAEFNQGDRLDYEPRKRATDYPAVPFGRSPEEKQADTTRARFEINVPTADAIVLFDGVKMTQTGLRRVLVTPPLVDGKIYSATIECSWKDEAGTTIRRKKAFDFVIGQQISHTFSE